MTQLEIKFPMLDLRDPRQLEYCRRGYGEIVLPERVSTIDGWLPTGFLAMTPDGQIIGRAVIAYESDPDFLVEVAGGAKSPWIYAVFVEHQFRGNGIGQMLISNCIEFLATHSTVSAVCLDTNTAGAWYEEKFGFIHSHSGRYEGDDFDIYYRPITAEDNRTGQAPIFHTLCIDHETTPA